MSSNTMVALLPLAVLAADGATSLLAWASVVWFVAGWFDAACGAGVLVAAGAAGLAGVAATSLWAVGSVTLEGAET